MNLEKSQRFSRAVVSALKRVRQSKGLSQERVARMAGLSRTAITMMEGGHRHPTLFVCHALARALGVRLSSLVAKAEKMRR